MLGVSAREFRDPVSQIVLMKADDWLRSSLIRHLL